MKSTILFFISVIFLASSSCKKETNPVPPPVKEVLLKELVIQNLPSPYYYFEYNASGQVNKAGFASGTRFYEMQYESNRLREMKNQGITNRDRVIYEYDNQGRVVVIKLADEGGTVYKRSFLTFDVNNRLKELEWELKVGTIGFAIERTLSFSYYPDGNLEERRDHRHFIDGRQSEALYVDRFEEYDNNINVEGFSLLHDGNEHLVLLPGLKLQINNPLKNKRTGDGVNYNISYTYTYNTAKVPTNKKGDMLLINGPQAGQHFELNTSYSYYE